MGETVDDQFAVRWSQLGVAQRVLRRENGQASRLGRGIDRGLGQLWDPARTVPDPPPRCGATSLCGGAEPAGLRPQPCIEPVRTTVVRLCNTKIPELRQIRHSADDISLTLLTSAAILSCRPGLSRAG